MAPAPESSRIAAASQVVVILAGGVVVHAGLRAAEPVFAPTILAFVIGVVLSPLSDFRDRIGIPHFLGALLSLILTLVLITVVAMPSLPIASGIVEAWPKIMGEVRETVAGYQNALQGLESSANEMERDLTGAGAEGEPAPAPVPAGDGGLGEMPSTMDALFLAPTVAGQTITFAGVPFFFLPTRRSVYAWIAGRIARERIEQEIAKRPQLAERQVARCVLTITVVNPGFGACVVAAMSLLDVPSPFIWGAVTFLMNDVLYLGPAIVFAALLVTGIVLFEGAYAIVPALAFLGLNMIEAQFVTPTAIGRTLSVNPLLIFVAPVFFLRLWGPLDGFIAIPLLLWVMVLSDEISESRRRMVEMPGEEGAEAAPSGSSR